MSSLLHEGPDPVARFCRSWRQISLQGDLIEFASVTSGVFPADALHCVVAESLRGFQGPIIQGQQALVFRAQDAAAARVQCSLGCFGVCYTNCSGDSLACCSALFGRQSFRGAILRAAKWNIPGVNTERVNGDISYLCSVILLCLSHVILDHFKSCRMETALKAINAAVIDLVTQVVV